MSIDTQIELIEKKKDDLKIAYDRHHSFILNDEIGDSEFNENWSKIKNLKESIDEELRTLKKDIMLGRFGRYGKLWNGFVLGWIVAAVHDIVDILFDLIKRIAGYSLEHPEVLIPALDKLIAKLKEQQDKQGRSI